MKKSILIVDDNKDFVSGLSKIISNFCMNDVKSIDICYTGLSCIEITNKKVFDIIFLDYDMPDIKGPEIAALINKENRHTKIIALSFHSGIEFIENMIYAGAISYIIKDELTLKKIKRCIQL